MIATWRTPKTEEQYQADRSDGLCIPLTEVEPMHEFQYWKVIDNAYPWDKVFRDHLMLIPKRGLPDMWDMNMDERNELLDRVIPYYVNSNGYTIVINPTADRSVLGIFHIHLGVKK